jgi:phage FluMu protein Com
MEKTIRCTKCGKRLIPVFMDNGRTELKCIRCEPVDPMRTIARKWAEGPLGAEQK